MTGDWYASILCCVDFNKTNRSSNPDKDWKDIETKKRQRDRAGNERKISRQIKPRQRQGSLEREQDAKKKEREWKGGEKGKRKWKKEKEVSVEEKEAEKEKLADKEVFQILIKS